jgi:hypothetical protein
VQMHVVTARGGSVSWACSPSGHRRPSDRHRSSRLTTHPASNPHPADHSRPDVRLRSTTAGSDPPVPFIDGWERARRLTPVDHGRLVDELIRSPAPVRGPACDSPSPVDAPCSPVSWRACSPNGFSYGPPIPRTWCSPGSQPAPYRPSYRLVACCGSCLVTGRSRPRSCSAATRRRTRNASSIPKKSAAATGLPDHVSTGHYSTLEADPVGSVPDQTRPPGRWRRRRATGPPSSVWAGWWPAHQVLVGHQRWPVRHGRLAAGRSAVAVATPASPRLALDDVTPTISPGRYGRALPTLKSSRPPPSAHLVHDIAPWRHPHRRRTARAPGRARLGTVRKTPPTMPEPPRGSCEPAPAGRGTPTSVVAFRGPRTAAGERAGPCSARSRTTAGVRRP